MVSLPLGALAKVGRSRRHAHELLGAIAEWTASAGLRQYAVIAEDRLSWSVNLDVPAPPPIRDWALIAGDAVHNARSALDVAVFELARGDQLPAVQQQAIAFPIVVDGQKWSGTALRLSMLPPQLLERIRLVQPFQRPDEERGGDMLPVLHALDIADKHRLPLTAFIKPMAIDHTFSIEFEDEPTVEEPPDVTLFEPQIAHGAVLLEGRSGHRIARISGTAEITLKVCIAVPNRGSVGVQEVLDNAALYAQRVVAFLADVGPAQSGERSPDRG